MTMLLLFVAVGFAAQFLGGSLGMGYGISCTSLLLLLGLSPLEASASVHATEVVTGLVVGLSHWRLRNVDLTLMLRLAVPGCIGALVGGHLLARVSTHAAKPWMAGLLLVLGVVVLARFVGGARPVVTDRPLRTALVAPLGLGAGFVDATGGGGWGALTTSTLLGTGRVLPRHAVGTADAAKCLVSIAATIGLVSGSGTRGIHPHVVLPLILGGVVAGPVAALVVTRLPMRSLGTLAGLAIIAINTPLVLTLAPDRARGWIALGLVVVVAVVLATTAASRARRAPSRDPAQVAG